METELGGAYSWVNTALHYGHLANAELLWFSVSNLDFSLKFSLKGDDLSLVITSFESR